MRLGRGLASTPPTARRAPIPIVATTTETRRGACSIRALVVKSGIPCAALPPPRRRCCRAASLGKGIGAAAMAATKVSRASAVCSTATAAAAPSLALRREMTTAAHIPCCVGQSCLQAEPIASGQALQHLNHVPLPRVGPVEHARQAHHLIQGQIYQPPDGSFQEVRQVAGVAP